MKRKIGLIIAAICCLFSTVVYSATALPIPDTTETEPDLLKLSHPYLPKTILPLPNVTTIPPKTLSIRDAIFLALRSNPDVKSSEIQRIVDKYQVILAKQMFRPQYTVNFTSTLQHGFQPIYNLTPGVNLLTHTGSQFGVNYANNLNGASGATTFSLTQPLLKGFGAVNTVPLYNAYTNEEIARLTFKNNIISSVVGVILAYRQLVQDYNNLDIQKRFLKQSKISLNQYELKVKTGKMAPSDIYQQKSTFETTKLSLMQQENALQQDYQNFLSSIGLVPNAKLNIDKKIDIQQYPLPSDEVSIQRALNGNIAYHQALLQLENTRRAIITAADERKWTLNLTASETIGSANYINYLNNIQSLVTDITTTAENGPSLLINFQLPVDNVQGKAAEVGARVQLEQAKLALEQKKEDLVRQVMTQTQTIRSDWQQIVVSQDAIAAQAATLKAAQLKLNYGRSTVFEVTQDQNLLLQQETSLVGTEVAYFNDITGLETLWGDTLNVWNIQLRY